MINHLLLSVGWYYGISSYQWYLSITMCMHKMDGTSSEDHEEETTQEVTDKGDGVTQKD